MSILLVLSSPRVYSPRLLELERVLTRDRDASIATGPSLTDSITQHLKSVPAERIRHYTRALQSELGADTNNDDVDLLTMRLLLNDFNVAVGHLRGVADLTATIVDEAAKPIRESQRFMKREDKREDRKRREAELAIDRPEEQQPPT
jgi:hypothetical protein